MLLSKALQLHIGNLSWPFPIVLSGFLTSTDLFFLTIQEIQLDKKYIFGTKE